MQKATRQVEEIKISFESVSSRPQQKFSHPSTTDSIHHPSNREIPIESRLERSPFSKKKMSEVKDARSASPSERIKLRKDRKTSQPKVQVLGLGLDLEGFEDTIEKTRIVKGHDNETEKRAKREVAGSISYFKSDVKGRVKRVLSNGYGVGSPSLGMEIAVGAQLLSPLPGLQSPVPPPLQHIEKYINPNEDLLDCIDTFLEDQYREQAQGFSCSNSLQSVSRQRTPRSILAKSSTVPLRKPISDIPITPIKAGKGSAGEDLITKLQLLRTPQRVSAIIAQKVDRVIVEPVQYKSRRKTKQNSESGESPVTPASPYVTNGYNIFSVPREGPIGRRTISIDSRLKGVYFTGNELESIEALANAKDFSTCTGHENCTDCRNQEFTYLQNKAMSTAIPPEERQKVINNNRSLRNIKNELENLLENGAISDEAYDVMMSKLPSEASLNKSARSAQAPSPAPSANLANLSINNAPPSYNAVQATPPALPGRKASNKGPSKPQVGSATALYAYNGNQGDCTFAVGDEILILNYVNNDWWEGHNVRTGVEGVFPQNYVQKHPEAAAGGGYYSHEKNSNNYATQYPGQYQPQGQNGPPPPGPSNPYNSSIPPMAVAEQPADGKPSKGGEMGKKFGKKLGNAAIFGAGATIGGNIVNSIF